MLIQNETDKLMRTNFLQIVTQRIGNETNKLSKTIGNETGKLSGINVLRDVTKRI
jgi:hypothetical protein